MVMAMNEIEYQSFLKKLIATLEADPLVHGLIALGSTAEPASRDRWSDHDFWIITSAGAQSRYLDTFSWLPQADDILLTVRHGLSYRVALYGNGHKVEYAVFDPQEAVSGKIERFQALIDRRAIGELAESIRLQTHQERAASVARPERLENLCVLLVTACERWERGERLSAQRYLQFALDAVLDLLVAHGGLNKSPLADELDPRRRLEQREPELGQELERFAHLVAAEAGVALLDLAERELRARAPELAWEKVSVVRKWLQEAGEAS
jgi:lincosamide nucleotidyltransferase B/F